MIKGALKSHIKCDEWNIQAENKMMSVETKN